MLTNTDLHNLKYPIVFKPVRCTRCSKDVSVINNFDEAQKYISETGININEILVQELVHYDNEIGILFQRNLSNNDGEIISMVYKNPDTNTKITPACHLYKKNCKDLTHLVTPKLNLIIKNISNSIPNFNVGRYDIKFKDLESLYKVKIFIFWKQMEQCVLILIKILIQLSIIYIV